MVSVIVVMGEYVNSGRIKYGVEDVIVYSDQEDAERAAEEWRQADFDAEVFHGLPAYHPHAAQMKFWEENCLAA